MRTDRQADGRADRLDIFSVGLTPAGSSTVHIYTEQHNETEYTEQKIHNNKNT